MLVAWYGALSGYQSQNLYESQHQPVLSVPGWVAI